MIVIASMLTTHRVVESFGLCFYVISKMSSMINITLRKLLSLSWCSALTVTFWAFYINFVDRKGLDTANAKHR